MTNYLHINSKTKLLHQARSLHTCLAPTVTGRAQEMVWRLLSFEYLRLVHDFCMEQPVSMGPYDA